MAHDLKRSDLWGTQPVSTVIVSMWQITACMLCTVIYTCDVFLRPNLNLFFFQKGSHCRFSSCTWLPSKNDSEMLLNAYSYCTSPSPHDYIYKGQALFAELESAKIIFIKRKGSRLVKREIQGTFFFFLVDSEFPTIIHMKGLFYQFLFQFFHMILGLL